MEYQHKFEKNLIYNKELRIYQRRQRMDFRFSPDEERFEQEVREFFLKEENISSEARKEWELGLGFGPNCWKMLNEIGKRGWLCPHGPKNTAGLNCHICTVIL